MFIEVGKFFIALLCFFKDFLSFSDGPSDFLPHLAIHITTS